MTSWIGAAKRRSPRTERRRSSRREERRIGRSRSRLESLSERQKQVFALLAEGLSNKAIARRLGIAEGTVKTHVATIFDVLNVHNRVSAVAAARDAAAVALAKPKNV